MTFIAVAVVFIGACAVIGLRRSQGSDVALTASLAAAAVCAQLVLLLTK